MKNFPQSQTTSPSSNLSLLTFNPLGFVTEFILTTKLVEGNLDVEYQSLREWKLSFFEKKKDSNFQEINKIDFNQFKESNLFFHSHQLQIEKKDLEALIKKDTEILENEKPLERNSPEDKNINPYESVKNRLQSNKNKLELLNQKLQSISLPLQVEKQKIWKAKIEVKTYQNKDSIWNSSRQFKFSSFDQMNQQEKDFYSQSQKYYNFPPNNNNNNGLNDKNNLDHGNMSFIDNYNYSFIDDQNEKGNAPPKHTNNNKKFRENDLKNQEKEEEEENTQIFEKIEDNEEKDQVEEDD